MSKFCSKPMCGTCKYHQVDDNEDWYCGNYDGDHYMDFTAYQDCTDCEDWEERK